MHERSQGPRCGSASHSGACPDAYRRRRDSLLSLRPLGLSSASAALGLSILWSGNVVAIKLGLIAFPPFWSAYWRFLIALAAVGLWARFRGLALMPEPNEWRPLGILAVLFTVQISILNLGVNWTSPSYGIVLLNAHPIFASLLAHFFVPGDRLSPRRVIGLATAFSGICVVFLGNPPADIAPRPLLGNLLVVLTSFLLGARLVYTNRLVQSIEPIRTVLWQTIFSVPAFLLAAWLFEPPLTASIPTAPMLALLYQGVVIAGVCFVGWTMLLKHHSPGTLSMFGFTAPLFGIFLSALFFGEAITARLWIGLVAVTAGILLVTRPWYSLPAPGTGPEREAAR